MSEIVRSDIVEGLKLAGLRKNDVVMVHSSLKSFGHVVGGPDTIIDSVLEVIGPCGTMMVPTNVFNGSVTEFLRKNKVTDLREAVSLTGIITETLRKRKDALRSVHPSHPVASVGRLAKEMLSEHHLGDSPIGAKSPYGKLAELDNGKILLLGVKNSNNSTIHLAEEYYTPYIFIGETFDTLVIDNDGKEHLVKVKGYCVNKPRNFTAADKELIEKKIMTRTKIGNAEVSCIKAKEMMVLLKEKIHEDPYYLLKGE